MVIFHSYVSLPEGRTPVNSNNPVRFRCCRCRFATWRMPTATWQLVDQQLSQLLSCYSVIPPKIEKASTLILVATHKSRPGMALDLDQLATQFAKPFFVQPVMVQSVNQWISKVISDSQISMIRMNSMISSIFL